MLKFLKSANGLTQAARTLSSLWLRRTNGIAGARQMSGGASESPGQIVWSVNRAKEVLMKTAEVDMSQFSAKGSLFLLEALLQSNLHHASARSILRSCAQKLEEMTIEELVHLCRILQRSRTLGERTFTQELSDELLFCLGKDLSRIQTAQQFLIIFSEFLENISIVTSTGKRNYQRLGEEMKQHAISLLLTFSPGDLCKLMRLLKRWSNGAGYMPQFFASCATAWINSFTIKEKIDFCRSSGDPAFCAKTAEQAVHLVGSDALSLPMLTSLLRELSTKRVCNMALMRSAASYIKSHVYQLKKHECILVLMSYAMVNVSDTALTYAVLQQVTRFELLLTEAIHLVYNVLRLSVVPKELLNKVVSSIKSETTLTLNHIESLNLLSILILAATNYPELCTDFSVDVFRILLEKVFLSCHLIEESVAQRHVWDFLASHLGGHHLVQQEVSVFHYAIDMVVVFNRELQPIPAQCHPPVYSAALLPPLLGKWVDESVPLLSQGCPSLTQSEADGLCRVAVEVNGPTHYCHGGGHRDGSGVMKELVLKALGYHVISVDVRGKPFTSILSQSWHGFAKLRDDLQHVLDMQRAKLANSPRSS